MRRILLIIGSDPRNSGRPAEAIRMAAGVGAWRKAQFTLLLRGPGVLALSEWADEFVDEDHFTRYVPLLRENGCEVLVEAGASEWTEVETPTIAARTVSAPEVAVLAAGHDVVMHF